MNKNQEVLFRICLKIRRFYQKNQSVLEPFSVAVSFFKQLKSKISDLVLADAESQSEESSYIMAKTAMRQSLEKLGLKVSNALATYSVINNDYGLQKKANFTIRSWYKFSEEELVMQGSFVRDLAQPFRTSLVSYGATENDVETLDRSINVFTDAISDPNLPIGRRKNDNVKVAELLEEMRLIFLEKLDTLMRNFESHNPDLYDNYLSARSGSFSLPTTVSEIPPKKIAVIFEATAYEPETLYTLQNLSHEAIFFSLSTNCALAGSGEVMLGAGETRSRLAEHLSPSGTFLIIRNPSPVEVKVNIWIE